MIVAISPAALYFIGIWISVHLEAKRLGLKGSPRNQLPKLWPLVRDKGHLLLPLITMLGLSLGSLLGGTAVVEVIFGYQGLGNLAVSAILNYDYNLVQGYVLWVALIYMVVNLLVDISYYLVDPRIRARS